MSSHQDGTHDSLSLRIGTRLAEFEVIGRIGDGGFSIVYLAMDHSLERTVALKEYMPSSLATRVGTTEVQPRSSRYRDTFDAGLKSFVNEAKLLAQFDHPSLVKVYRFWEANGTAYMVMPFYQGITLKDAIRAMPQPPDEAWLLGVLAPLTEALRVIHAERCYHRDIAPDNVVLLEGSQRPLLLDFGAARRVIGDMTQALTVILKAGYAPVEQYAEVPGMKQGPWTDVYALAAVVHWAIVGKTPPPSVGRMLGDAFVPLSELAAGRYSAGFLQAIDRALTVLPDRRTPSIDAFRHDLGLDREPEVVRTVAAGWDDSDATVIRPAVRAQDASTSSVHAETAAGPRGPSVIEPSSALAQSPPPAAPTTVPATARPAPDPLSAPQASTTAGASPAVAARRSWPIVPTALVLGAALVIGAGWWALPRINESRRAVERPAPSGSDRAPVGEETAGHAAPTALPGERASIGAVTETPASSTATTPATTSTTSATTPAPLSTTAPTTATGPTTTTAPTTSSEPRKEPTVSGLPSTSVGTEPASSTEAPSSPPEPQASSEDNATPRHAGAATAPPSTLRAPVVQSTQHAPPRATKVPSESETKKSSSSEAECARIFQRLSLGETSPELIARVKSLNCR